MKEWLYTALIFVILAALLVAVVLFCSGCAAAEPTIVADSNGVIHGQTAMVEIGDGLWYDSSTRIVYWWNGNIASGYQSSTTPSPYYAPNGLPYKYNPITNEFEEIEK
jgi:hypothetical protein